MPKPKTDPHAEALAEIDRWVEWFRRAHEERLASPVFFPDQHLVAQERATIAAQAEAIGERMKSDYRARQRT